MKQILKAFAVLSLINIAVACFSASSLLAADPPAQNPASPSDQPSVVYASGYTETQNFGEELTVESVELVKDGKDELQKSVRRYHVNQRGYYAGGESATVDAIDARNSASQERRAIAHLQNAQRACAVPVRQARPRPATQTAPQQPVVVTGFRPQMTIQQFRAINPNTGRQATWNHTSGPQIGVHGTMTRVGGFDAIRTNAGGLYVDP